MIEAGEPLGNRYVIVDTVEDPRPGTLVQVADRNGARLVGQILMDTPAVPAIAGEVRTSLMALPALTTVLKPRDLALTSAALPVAIFDRPSGLVTASSRLAEVVEARGRRDATIWLFQQLASVANDLAQVHLLGAVHGAITSSVLTCGAAGDVGPILLSGFGIEPFARDNDPSRAAARRADLVGLLNALHDLFAAAGVAPEGGAAAKWLLLRTSAQHGEHPALASGSSLAATFNELALIRPDEAPRAVRAPTLAPPRAAGAMRASTIPPPGRRSETPRRPTTAPPPPSDDPTLPPPPEPSRPLVNLKFVIPGVLAITGLVAAGVWYANQARHDVGVARLNVATPARNPVAAPTCRGESGPPEGVVDFRAPEEFDVQCLEEPDRLALLSRNGTNVQLVTRPATRGAHYGTPVDIAHGAVELGSSRIVDHALWTAWRNGVGAPFGLARFDGQRVSTVAVPIARWDSVPLHGAWLLHVDARAAWIASSVLGDDNQHVLLLQVTFGPAAPDVIAWNVGPGTLLGMIPGDTPTLLVERHAANDATHHELTAATLNLNAIAAAHHPADATAVGGAALGDDAVTRSRPITLEGAVLGSSYRGLRVGRAPTWLLGRGNPQTPDNCVLPDRCHTAGPVVLVSFPAQGAPTTTTVTPSGWAVDLAAGDDGAFTAITTNANVAGLPMPTHRAYEFSAAGVATGVDRPLAAAHAPRGRVVRCGGEAWMAFDATTPNALLTITPRACAEGR